MELWDKVVLFGNFDGFTYALNDLSHAVVSLENGERVEVPVRCVMSKDKIVEKDKIKLKDVIKRIEKFDLATKAVWINEILYKLGSDYGLHKYYTGYKQGKFDGAMERDKVIVPQFAADFIAEQKKLGHTLSYSIDACMSDRVAEWYWDNSELFAQAWIFGYKIEQGKRYLVKMKGVSEENTYLTFRFGHMWMLSNFEECEEFRLHHTRKELEEAGFGWVFDCPGIEIEEVEE